MGSHYKICLAVVICLLGGAFGASPAWSIEGDDLVDNDAEKLQAAYECDKLATRPLDISSPAKGVAFAKIDAEPAIRACREATRQFPATGRFYTQLARALLKVKRLGQAGRALKKAENLKHPPALNIIGYMYENGLSVVRNARKARRYYERAAKPGDAYGQFNMGRVFLKGIGGAKSRLIGMDYLQKSAAKGMQQAMYMLGDIERNRRGGSTKKAFEWFEKAAKAGHLPSQNLLSYAYSTGEGVAKNPALAMKWSKMAAKSGDAEAQMRLGQFYMEGVGVREDPDKAAMWFRKASEQGNIAAQARLGSLYLYGQGVEKNLSEALRWLRKAASKGEALAIYTLGVMYEKGLGVTQNLSHARYYYKEAAEAGNLEAQLKLDEVAKIASATNQDAYAAYVKRAREKEEAEKNAVESAALTSPEPGLRMESSTPTQLSSLGLVGRLD